MQKQTPAIPSSSLVTTLVGVLLWLELQCPAAVLALASGDYFLRRMGSDVLSVTSPTAATAQFQDSPAVTRTAYQEIGEWVATPADSSLRLSATTALHAWLGLKNSDDQGTYFDLRAELRKNGVVIASGETKNIQGVTRNANQAKEVLVTFGTLVNAHFTSGDVLSVRILAKVADSGGHNSATGVRLYYDATTRPARFGTTFAPVNTPPGANAGADQTGVVGQTVQLDGSGSSDVDGDPLTYQWSLTAKPTGSGTIVANPTSVTPTLTLDKPGNYTGQLIVNDGTVNSAPDTVVISTVNSVPVANAGADQTGVVGQTIPLDGSSSSDVDGNPLTYQWTLTGRPTGSSATVTNSTSVTPTVTLDKPGNYIGQLIVNDGVVNSAPDTVVISTMNSAPVAHAGPDQTYFVGDTAQLDGSGSSDVDGDPLTYQWALTAVPPGSAAALSDPTVVAPTFVLDRPGTYVVQLLVHDGTVSSAPDTVTISTTNSKPLAQAGSDQSALVGTRVFLDGSASSDVDGDPLSYQWSVTARPTGSTATLDNPATVAPSFLVDQPGTYTVQLIVNDGVGDSTPDTVSINTLNTKPVANAGPDQEVHVGDTVQLDGSGSADADGDPLSYQWSLASLPTDSMATLTSVDTSQTTFEPDVAGTYVAQLIVNDGTADSEPGTTTVTVTVLDTDPPPAPDLSRITVGLVTNEQVTITGAVGSVEGNGRVRVTNVRTGQTVIVTALADGSFTVQIAAQEWDTLRIVVADGAGNASPVVTAQVEGSEGALSVTVTEPPAGVTLASNRILVRGIVQGPPNTGVTVNGIVATVQAGRFIASQVPLTQGSNTLIVTATTLKGHTATTSVTVTSEGFSPALELVATPASGVVSSSYPLYVTFTYEFHAATVAQSLNVDFDGDGTNDIVDADPTAVFLGFYYANPGIYLAHLSLTDQQGNVFQAEAPVVVQDVVPADAMFKGIWNGMNAVLVAGDKATALTFLTRGAQEKYGPVFDVLLPHMVEIIVSFSSFRGVHIGAGYAEYALNTTINGENRLFLIYFLKEQDGVWRLDAM